MALRKIDQIIDATQITEGAGVAVYRSIGTPALRNLDPFVMLDFFGSDQPDQYLAGFPDHPHRGFNTFTYMLDGHMLHQDSMGNRGDLFPGGAQWMKAGSGIIHSEMPQQTQGLMRGLQLWVNLPAEQKMTLPNYQEYAANLFPVIRQSGMTTKVLLGQYHRALGPIHDPHTHVQYFDVDLKPGATFHHDCAADLVCFIYVFEGSVSLGKQRLSNHQLAVFGEGDSIHVQADTQAARFIIVMGCPIGEPIVQAGPFVMNTREEIQQANMDYQNGTLVQDKAQVLNA